MRPFHRAALLCAAVVLCAAAPAHAAPPDGPGPFADSVVSVDQGRTVTGDPVASTRSDPGAALGAPEPPGGFPEQTGSSLYSLGYRGTLVLGFDNAICNGTGADFGLSVISDESFAPQERADVFVSADGESWSKVADDVDRNTNVGLPSSILAAYFVKIVDVSTDGPDQSADGYDVDAVRALNTDCPQADLGLATPPSGGSQTRPGTENIGWTVINNGPDDSPAQQVKLTFTSVSGDNPAGPRPSHQAQGELTGCDEPVTGDITAEPVVLTCKLGAMAPGASRTVTYKIPNDFAYQVKIDATVRAIGIADPDPTNNHATNQVLRFKPTADLRTTIAESLNGHEPTPYDDEATVQITNDGPGSPSVPTVDLVHKASGLGAELTVVDGCQSSTPLPQAGPGSPGVGSQGVRCVLPRLNAGQSTLVRVRIQNPGSGIEGQFEAIADGAELVDDPDRADNRVSMGYKALEPGPDMEVQLFGASSTNFMATPTYSVAVLNRGPGVAIGAAVEFVLSNFSGNVTAPPNCTLTHQSPRRYICSLGDFPEGSLYLKFKVQPTMTSGSFTVKTTILNAVNDPDLANNSRSRAVTVSFF